MGIGTNLLFKFTSARGENRVSEWVVDASGIQTLIIWQQRHLLMITFMLWPRHLLYTCIDQLYICRLQLVLMLLFTCVEYSPFQSRFRQTIRVLNEYFEVKVWGISRT